MKDVRREMRMNSGLNILCSHLAISTASTKVKPILATGLTVAKIEASIGKVHSF